MSEETKADIKLLDYNGLQEYDRQLKAWLVENYGWRYNPKINERKISITVTGLCYFERYSDRSRDYTSLQDLVGESFEFSTGFPKPAEGAQFNPPVPWFGDERQQEACRLTFVARYNIINKTDGVLNYYLQYTSLDSDAEWEVQVIPTGTSGYIFSGTDPSITNGKKDPKYWYSWDQMVDFLITNIKG